MDYKLKNVFKFMYFIIQQITVGIMYWVVHSYYNTCNSTEYKLLLSIVFIVSVIIPNIQNNDRLIKNRIIILLLETSIAIIVFSVLYSKIGVPIIIFE
ncbi:hypothetical protein FQB35_12555 [Crassaminicella thermophila]|uniref:Uncharacterized protein n=1 Tax=Crassaminicella thermophila TaxID=2599308 RepID=A0A5C0SFE0_CRATE|nr:hypothetical protein [Crassaminicella thermophila]QEK13081.1 hypothetical protein FQB35_12555 [Crassaminicella thermophila]